MICDREWGKWERFSSGFGSRMMKKMGYIPGRGLGRKGEGIVNPVKAENIKFGQSGAKVDMSKSFGGCDDGTGETHKEEEEAFQQDLQQWQRTYSGGMKSHPNYVFKAVDELKKTNKARRYSKKHKQSKGKIIDMTVRKTKVLNSFEDIRKQNTSSVASIVPELFYNITIIIDEIQRERMFKEHNEDLIINLMNERHRLHEMIEYEHRRIISLSDISQVFSFLESDASQQSVTEFVVMLSQLRMKYPQEYKEHQLSSAITIVFPKINSLLAVWNMFSDPVGPFEVFRQLRDLLKESQHSSHLPAEPDRMDVYDRLVWEVWMPNLRQVLSKWSVKTEVSNIIDLLQNWMPLLPEWILCNILDNNILPKLQEQVEDWNPTTDPIPIHTWIHPWLPIMDKSLEVLYPLIRLKLGMALTNWHPSDSSAVIILSPWAKVFSPEIMEAFLIKTIIPKLEFCLKSLIINPQHQAIAPIEWILDWKKLLGCHHLANLFDKHFFPKWLHVLANWLSSENPDFDEVINWYCGWKSVFETFELEKSNAVIESNFKNALIIMNRTAQLLTSENVYF
jgi:tuftelin-interacting protein 11